jgi:hypothetical protein
LRLTSISPRHKVQRPFDYLLHGRDALGIEEIVIDPRRRWHADVVPLQLVKGPQQTGAQEDVIAQLLAHV